MYSMTSLSRLTREVAGTVCTLWPHCAGLPGRWLELYVLYDLIVQTDLWGGWNCMYSMTSLCRLTCEVAGLGNYVLMWKEGKRVISAGSLMVRPRKRESRVRQRARQRKKDWEVLLIYSIMQTSSTVVCNIITGSMRTIDEGFIKKRRQRSYLFNPLPC